MTAKIYKQGDKDFQKNILELRDGGDSVIIKMDKKGFRSCYHAFKVARIK